MLVGFVDQGHDFVVAAGVGMEFPGHDAAAAREGIGVDFGVEVEQAAEGCGFVAAALAFDLVEEALGEAVELAGEEAGFDFLAEVGAGGIARHEEEDFALVELGEVAEGVEASIDAFVAEPEHAASVQPGVKGHLELIAVDGNFRQDFGLVEIQDELGVARLGRSGGMGNHGGDLFMVFRGRRQSRSKARAGEKDKSWEGKIGHCGGGGKRVFSGDR